MAAMVALQSSMTSLSLSSNSFLGQRLPPLSLSPMLVSICIRIICYLLIQCLVCYRIFTILVLIQVSIQFFFVYFYLDSLFINIVIVLPVQLSFDNESPVCLGNRLISFKISPCFWLLLSFYLGFLFVSFKWIFKNYLLTPVHE